MTKLIIQSDDYGITRAAACGIIHGIKNGVVRNTGLFANMAWAEECVEMIRPYLDEIALGIDLNASTGPSLLGHDKVPSLCHENGMFLTSGENRALDTEENGFDHVNHDELYAEFDAQIQKYVELVGKLPDYIHGHAYGTKTTQQVTEELIQKYQLPSSSHIGEIEGFKENNMAMGWYQYGGPERQLTEDLISYIVEDKNGYLDSEYGYLVTHCGYADAELFKLSSFNTCRVKDLEALTSDEVKQWIVDNNVELITFKDIKDKFKF